MKSKTGLLAGLLLVLLPWITGCSGTIMAKDLKNRLTEKKWLLVTLNEENIPEKRMISTEFNYEENKGEYKISGFSGCNMFMGSANISDKNLTVQRVSCTRKACKSPEDIMRIEALFLKTLESSSGYSLKDDYLNITDQTGKNILSFKAGDKTAKPE